MRRLIRSLAVVLVSVAGAAAATADAADTQHRQYLRRVPTPILSNGSLAIAD